MIYIIVPTFARVNETKKFLCSIEKSIKKEYLVLLIDDHPEKVTFNAINNNNHVKVFPSQKELWWVGSVNYGIKILFEKYAVNDKDIVVFANNDVQIDQSCFDVLEKEIHENNNQIVHPRTFNQDKVEVSSGSNILMLFPYLTNHPKDFKKEKEIINMGTTRFLMTSGSVLTRVGYINKELVQYGGDNDFTLSANRYHDINTYILRDAICRLDDTETGIKNHNVQSVTELYKSFFSIKSPNNIKYRYILFKKFFGKVGSFFITVSLSLNTILKFIISKKIIN